MEIMSDEKLKVDDERLLSDVSQAGYISKLNSGIKLGDYFTMGPSKTFTKDTELVILLRMEDVSEDGNIINQNIVPYFKIKKGLTYFERNDVLVAKITPCFENGKGACLDLISTAKGFGSTEFHVLRVNENAVPRYIFYHTQTKRFRKNLQTEMIGTAGHRRVPASSILQYSLPVFHTKQEQSAIARAIHDIDLLISALDGLIIKKRNIKQGVMQQLLTGEKRLPGFTEKWQMINFENACAKEGLIRGPFGGSLTKDSFVDCGFKVYEQRNAIYRNTHIGTYYIDNNKYQELRRFEVKAGEFIVSCSGTIGKIYQIPENSEPGIINQALLKIKINSKILHDKFFYYYFEWDKFQEKIIDNTQGGAMKNLVGMDIFRKLPMFLPLLSEQQAIAQILSDIDFEIKCLEKQRDKTKLIKQGMMQELLTGKTRLI